jgi:hypothetical protein
MTPQAVVTDIRAIIAHAIEAGLSDQQRYPALKQVGRNDYDIHIQNSPDLSWSLKDKPYEEIYEELNRGGAFNLRMLDGALVQMLYTFRGNEIATHRLAMFPSPHLDIYEDAQQDYDADVLYAEIVGRNLVRFPVRFDFYADDGRHIDVAHPKSHLTLGQYKSCRIPVTGPLTPTKFMSFIIRSFYNPAINRFKFGEAASRARFPETITDNEREVGYFAY